ncbi:MAG: hypothetical protein ACYTGC_01310 [Planctomycetota bacterium]|jgi:hypothetical protein
MSMMPSLSSPLLGALDRDWLATAANVEAAMISTHATKVNPRRPAPPASVWGSSGGSV